MTEVYVEKSFGKISSAEFGSVKDYPFLIGLQLCFEGPDWGVADGGRFAINMNPKANWPKSLSAPQAIHAEISRLSDLLKAAKVNYVSELKGKPVEVTFENRTFKSFRILTEVL